MKASLTPLAIGRIGGLAIGLGVGAAVLAMPAVACADTVDAADTAARSSQHSTRVGGHASPSPGPNAAGAQRASQPKASRITPSQTHSASRTASPAESHSAPTSPVPAAAAKAGKGPVKSLIGIFVGDGTATHPNAGILAGNGYSWTAETCNQGQPCTGGQAGLLLGNGGNGFGGGNGGSAGFFGRGGIGGAGLNGGDGGNGGRGGLLWGDGGDGGAGAPVTGAAQAGGGGGTGGATGAFSLFSRGGAGGDGGSAAGSKGIGGAGGSGGATGLFSMLGIGGTGGEGGTPTGANGSGGVGGAGGDSGRLSLVGTGGTGGSGGWGAAGGSGGNGALWFGTGGAGGAGGPGGVGGAGGRAGLFGKGGAGGAGGAAANGGAGGAGGAVAGDGGSGGPGGVAAGGGAGGRAGGIGKPGFAGSDGGEPVVPMWFDPSMDDFSTNFTIGGQPIYNVEVDTGSSGLIVPITQIDVTTLGPAIGNGVAKFGDWGSFYYTSYATQLDFGNGMVTAPVPIGVFDQVKQCDGSECAFIPQSDWWQYPDIKPIIGVGPYTGYPIASPLRAMPGSLAEGFLFTGLVNQGSLTFGVNPLPAVTSVPGWFYTSLSIDVSFQGESTATDVYQYSVIDSGGLGGGVSLNMLPANLHGVVAEGDSLPVGTTISVYPYQDRQTLLYTTTVGTEPTTFVPSVWDPNLGFNTGIIPFMQGPIYFSYTPTYDPVGPDGSFGGTTSFDYAP